jgi:urea ABC transporter ATP-binding protein UrtE
MSPRSILGRNEMTELLKTVGVVCGYGGGTVLDGVSISVDAGEIVTLIGRNGVGKTTLMRALIGLVPLTHGSIRVNGLEVGSEQPHIRARRGIGYVPQGREVFAAMTVRENLQVGLQRNRAQATEMLDRIFDFFPVLGTRLNQKAGTMSGGEQQQLAIGRALVALPRILLLDEPSEGIQPSIVQLIGETLRKIASETQIGILLVEQDMGMVTDIGDRCCVMDKGRIVDTLDKTQIADDQLMRRYLTI